MVLVDAPITGAQDLCVFASYSDLILSGPEPHLILVLAFLLMRSLVIPIGYIGACRIPSQSSERLSVASNGRSTIQVHRRTQSVSPEFLLSFLWLPAHRCWAG